MVVRRAERRCFCRRKTRVQCGLPNWAPHGLEPPHSHVPEQNEEGAAQAQCGGGAAHARAGGPGSRSSGGGRPQPRGTSRVSPPRGIPPLGLYRCLTCAAVPGMEPARARSRVPRGSFRGDSLGPRRPVTPSEDDGKPPARSRARAPLPASRFPRPAPAASPGDKVGPLESPPLGSPPVPSGLGSAFACGDVARRSLSLLHCGHIRYGLSSVPTNTTPFHASGAPSSSR